MVDIFALAIAHGLLALAVWRLLQREDLDSDPVGRTDDNARAVSEPGGRPGRGRRPEMRTAAAPSRARKARQPRRMIVPGRNGEADAAEGEDMPGDA